VRKNSSANGDYPRVRENDDSRFADNLAALQSIVTSSAQNDSGLFELNFRDERYLPFEGAGAISSWRIELPREFHQFDYDTISDVILHMRYTAREGGEALREKAVKAINDLKNPLFQPAKNNPLLAPLVGDLESSNASSPESFLLLSAKHDFPTEWSRFASATEIASLEILLTKNLFPYPFHDKNLTVSRVGVALVLSKKNKVDLSSVKMDITLPPPQDVNQAQKTFSLNLNHVPLETSSDQLFARNTDDEQVPVQVVGEIIVHEGLPQSKTEPTYSLKISNIRDSADKAIVCANIDEILMVFRYVAES
jgi:Tc toxin complex TcA C-terminal TcB-binding domain